MNNMINNNINSIERMAEVISKRKKQDVNASYDGPSFTEILSRQKSIDELVSERTDVKKAVAQKATAYKGEDKYFISSFVISGRRGDPAQFFFRANEKRHAFVSSLHRLFIV